MKQAYMAGDDNIDKQEFLRLYGVFGHHLAEDYSDYAMDDLSYAIYKTTDLSAIKARRRENAKYLHEHLKLRFLASLTENACPLFVPVFFNTKEERDHVRKKLIEAEIYCPIHWPKPTLIPAEYEVNKIYDTELSLICDQRYGILEMQRIIETIQ
jgi:dTDP-4-amino-4,6-dideoxygalactose transaminase